jgi:hypothetical protein
MAKEAKPGQEGWTEFRRAWTEAADAGRVDAFGSAECFRAAEAWIAEHHPGDMSAWVEQWAKENNKAPKKAEHGAKPRK